MKKFFMSVRKNQLPGTHTWSTQKRNLYPKIFLYLPEKINFSRLKKNSSYFSEEISNICPKKANFPKRTQFSKQKISYTCAKKLKPFILDVL